MSACVSVRQGLIWQSQRPIGSFHVAHNFRRLFLLDHFHCALPPSCFLENTELGWLGGEEACALRHEGYQQIRGNFRIPSMSPEVLTCPKPALCEV